MSSGVLICVIVQNFFEIGQRVLEIAQFVIFSARCNIYISHLCYDASIRLSVHLSVTFVHCGHRVQWIPDIFACLDRWMSLLFTDNASPASSDGMMPGYLVEVGGYGKIGNCSDITYFTF